MATSPSRDRVTARFAQLRDAYEEFDVQQTTVSVDAGEYEAVLADFGGIARAEVRVRNDAGEVLAVREGDGDGDHLGDGDGIDGGDGDGDDGWRAPETEVGASEPIADTACDAVHESTGVRPAIRTLDRVAIVSIATDDPEKPPVYRLHVRFEADVDAGTAGEGAAWREEPPETDWL